MANISAAEKHFFSTCRLLWPQFNAMAELPGLGVDSAQQIIAEVGPIAASFPSAKSLSS